MIQILCALDILTFGEELNVYCFIEHRGSACDRVCDKGHNLRTAFKSIFKIPE